MDKTAQKLVPFRMTAGRSQEVTSSGSDSLPHRYSSKALLDAARTLDILSTPDFVRSFAQDVAHRAVVNELSLKAFFRTYTTGHCHLAFRYWFAPQSQRLSVLLNSDLRRERHETSDYFDDPVDFLNLSRPEYADAQKFVRELIQDMERAHYKLYGGKRDHHSATVFFKAVSPRRDTETPDGQKQQVRDIAITFTPNP